MTWMTKLHETYDKTIKNPELTEHPDPYFHIMEGCHIEITISENGDFKAAQSLIIEKKYGKKIYYEKTKTIIPITPKSLTGRTSGAAPYPLAEKLQYLAKDYIDFGGTKTSYFSQYIDQLSNWVNHNEYSHWKAGVVKKYVEKGCVIKDLVNSDLLFVFLHESKQKLITKWKEQGGSDEKKPALIHSVIGGEQGNAIVRWRVQKIGVPDDTTWHDDELIKSWQSYQKTIHKNNGFCQILGREAFVTSTHPKAIYPQAVNSKLISTPTDKGYLTYLGRFTDELQPVGISFEVSQKSHNALRWLIRRGQGKQIGESSGKNKPGMIVSWAVSGADIPRPMDNSFDFLWGDIKETTIPHNINNTINHNIDIGQSFANELSRYMSGFKAKLKETDNIVIMGLDSATDGRMAITYYQEFFPKVYIERISQWHNDFAWPQRYTIEEDAGKSKPVKKTIWHISAPPPRAIWEAIYGTHLNDSLKKNTIERILPCIVEARPFPHDLVLKAVQKASNRSAYKSDEQWLWEKNLGIACALYRGYCKRNPKQTKEFDMALEENNNSRDYLYGRLLAIAERLEDIALNVAGENRNTTAARLMQRFADHPATTWRNIELALQPYIQRLKNNRAGFLHNIQTLWDEVMGKFKEGDFIDDKPLTGEFLLAYHSQRLIFRNKEQKTETPKVEK